MAAWLTIAVTDLNDYLVAAQMTALRSAALASGQTDPFARVMPDRCTYIRNRISNRISISATANAVPPELKTCACMLIIEAMQTRLPLKLSDDQRRAIERAYKDLDIAGSDEFPISEPDDPMTPTVQRGTGIHIDGRGERQATRETLKGL